VDRIIDDLEEVRLGDTVMTAHLTPGHTKGCTTWTTKVEDNGREYDVVFVCGARMNAGEPLLKNPDYPNMAEDFAYTFAKLKILPVDFFLGGHGYWFNMTEKMGRMQQGGGGNPFIDPEGYLEVIKGWEDAYLQQLKVERDALRSGSN
jgi:metallo-beta-lactamase class B